MKLVMAGKPISAVSGFRGHGEAFKVDQAGLGRGGAPHWQAGRTHQPDTPRVPNYAP